MRRLRGGYIAVLQTAGSSNFMSMISPFSILSTLCTVVLYIYKACDGVKENREECKRFCDHANLVLKALQSRCTGETPAEFTERLLGLQSAIEEIKTSVAALSKQSFGKRIVHHEALSMRIRRAYNEMNTVIHAFNLGAIVDMAALKQARETARRVDRHYLDKRCTHVLNSSKGDHDLLEQLQIRQEEMQQVLVSIRKRLPAVQIQSERRMLETSLQALERRSARKHNLPDEFIITRPDILVHRNLKLGQGGFARVYEADWRGTRVAVKELESDIPISVVEQEINVWRRLHHPHIVQFFGACSISDPPFMVCALKANGNINEYLAKSPRANRCKLLHEASLGLVYLHQQGVVHGDLKGSNILVDEFGKAFLSDFGLAKIKTYSTAARNGSQLGDGTLRWMAPEQLTTGLITKQSDMYSFGMTIYEIYSGHPPFISCPDSAVIDNVSRGVRPPTLLNAADATRRGLTAELWSFIEECWRQESDRRPSAARAAERLSSVAFHSKRLQRSHSSNDVRRRRSRQQLLRRSSNPHLPADQEVTQRVVPAVPPIPPAGLLMSPPRPGGGPRKTVRWDLAQSAAPQYPSSPGKPVLFLLQGRSPPGAASRGKVLTRLHQSSPSVQTQAQCTVM